MEIIALAIGGLLLLATRSSGGGDDKKKTDPKPAPSSGDGGLIGDLSKIPVVGAWAAAGTVAAWAGNRLSKAITGDQRPGSFDVISGVVSGKPADLSHGFNTDAFLVETSAIIGVAENVGSQTGRGLNELLGGRGDKGADAVAQALGGVWGIFLVFDPVNSTGIALGHALIYGAYSQVSDVVRLNYGQKGALADYSKSWDTAYFTLRGIFSSKPGADPKALTPWKDEVEADRWVTPLADGYARHLNRLAFREWMSRPHGVGLDDAGHAEYGRVRGYFVGKRLADGSLVEEPAPRSGSDEYRERMKAYPEGAVQAEAFERVRTYRWKLVLNPERKADPPAWVTPAQLELPESAVTATGPAPTWKSPGAAAWLVARPDILPEPPVAFWNPKNEFDRVFVSDFWVVTWVPVIDMVIGWRDPLVTELLTLGEAIANVGAWKQWLAEPHGSFVSDFQHAQVGRKQDRFDGQPESDGKSNITGLRYHGALIDSTGSLVPG